MTSRSAVADRPCNALCLSVVSFSSTICRAQSFIIFLLWLQIYCCIQLNFVLLSSSLICRRLCGKLHGGPSQLLLAHQQSLTDSQILAENHDFCLPHLHSMIDASVTGGPYQNIAITFCTKKPAWHDSPMVKMFWRFVYWFRQSPRMWQMDRRTDRQTLLDSSAWWQRPRLCIASCGIVWLFLKYICFSTLLL